MPDFDVASLSIWTFLGIIGGILFFGRFYVQWIVSELRKESVIPVSFWYMSIAGSLLLFPYAVYRVSPGGTVSLCFNVVVYTRNLVHVWRARGTLRPFWNNAIHVAAGAIVAVALVLTVFTWRHAYGTGGEGFWLWTAVWAAGQGLFFLRFLVQWLATEYNRRSTVPRAFWHLSIAGTVFHMFYFVYRMDWILAVGTIADGFIYVRNLYLPPAPSQALTRGDTSEQSAK